MGARGAGRQCRGVDGSSGSGAEPLAAVAVVAPRQAHVGGGRGGWRVRRPRSAAVHCSLRRRPPAWAGEAAHAQGGGGGRTVRIVLRRRGTNDEATAQLARRIMAAAEAARQGAGGADAGAAGAEPSRMGMGIAGVQRHKEMERARADDTIRTALDGDLASLMEHAKAMVGLVGPPEHRSAPPLPTQLPCRLKSSPRSSQTPRGPKTAPRRHKRWCCHSGSPTPSPATPTAAPSTTKSSPASWRSSCAPGRSACVPPARAPQRLALTSPSQHTFQQHHETMLLQDVYCVCAAPPRRVDAPAANAPRRYNRARGTLLISPTDLAEVSSRDSAAVRAGLTSPSPRRATSLGSSGCRWSCALMRAASRREAPSARTKLR